jgi:hypothetical protein
VTWFNSCVSFRAKLCTSINSVSVLYGICSRTPHQFPWSFSHKLLRAVLKLPSQALGAEVVLVSSGAEPDLAGRVLDVTGGWANVRMLVRISDARYHCCLTVL